MTRDLKITKSECQLENLTTMIIHACDETSFHKEIGQLRRNEGSIYAFLKKKEKQTDSKPKRWKLANRVITC